MAQRFFVHKTTGIYLGSFDVPDTVTYKKNGKDENGNDLMVEDTRTPYSPGANYIEVNTPPISADQVYDKVNKTWSQYVAPVIPAPLDATKIAAQIKAASGALNLNVKVSDITG